MLAATRKAIISTASKATYATAATATKVTTVSNGVKVASSEEPGQSASLAIVIGGGARAETSSNAGAAHFLKNYGFKNNTSRTAFRVTREAELAGAVLSSNLTHESLVYSAEFLKDDVELFAEILSDVVTKQKFQDHEFVDVAHQTAAEASNAWATAEINAIEAAHQTAFRNGLGNSIFAKPTAHINNAAVKAFAKELFTSGNVAFVGTGVEHEALEALAESFLTLPSGQLSLAASKYYGGDARVNTVSKNGQYVLAYEGAAANTTEYAALQVLRFALGGEVNIKNTVGAGVLAQAAAKFSAGTSINAFNLGYSDAGLFGVQVSASTAETGAAISAAAEQLKAVSKGLSAEDFGKAVAQAKYAATAGFETRLDRLETLGAQALQSGKYISAADAVSVYEKVTASDVAKVAEKLLSGKATTVAVGDLTNLPYADSLSL